MNRGEVLVGIVTRDRADLLRKALESAMAQDYPKRRIGVVNDGSTDQTALIASDYPMVEWTRWTESRGYMAGRNFLMASPRSEYYASLDDDAWFIRGDELRVAIDYLEKHPKVAAVAFDILSPDKPRSKERGNAREVSTFIGCGHLLRLSAINREEAYVASPGEYGGEEKDLALRLMDAGYKIMLLPGVHVWHDKTPQARVQEAQHRSGVCNDLAMTLRRTPLMALPFALAAKVYKHMRFSRAHGLEQPCREGLKLFFSSLGQIWRTRRPVHLATLRRFVSLSHAPSVEV